MNANITVTFDQQANHIAHILKEGLRRGTKVVECSQQAQDAWIEHLHATAIDMTPLQRECTPGYYYNEGEEKFRYFLGEPYGPGYDAFDALIRDWRDKGDLAGLVVET